jgi:hypothetical protein
LAEHLKEKRKMNLLAKKYSKLHADSAKRNTPFDMISSDEDSNGEIKVRK